MLIAKDSYRLLEFFKSVRFKAFAELLAMLRHLVMLPSRKA